MGKEIDIEKLKNLRPLGAGACATVYQFQDKAIKIFKDVGIDYENLNQLVGLQNQTCIFPEEILEDDNGKITGYIMQYVEGEKLGDVINQIDFELLQSAISKVEQDLQTLSSEKVLFNDLNVGNVMWNTEKQCIQIIDTDGFEKNEELTEEQVYSYNLQRFNEQMETFIGTIDGKLFNFLRETDEYNQFYQEYLIRGFKGQNASTTELLQVINRTAEKEFGRTFLNLGEIKEVVALREQTNQKDDGGVRRKHTYI